MKRILSNSRSVLEIETPIIITPDQIQTYSENGTGGGYTPSEFAWSSTANGDGWGADMKRPKGTGGKGTIHNIATPNVMNDFMGEQNHNQSVIDTQYNSRFSTVIADIERELSEQKVTAKYGQTLSASESASIDQKVTLELIHETKSKASSLETRSRGLKGLSPFFLMEVLPRNMMADFLNSRVGTPESLTALYNSFDDAYSSALEIKALSISERALTNQLAETAAQKDRADLVEGKSNNLASQDHRLSTIERERDIYAQQLPKFLQSELSIQAGQVPGHLTSQTLRHHQATLDRMAANKLAEVQPVQAPPPFSSGGITLHFPANNPKINAPLSKPELEALNELVYLQKNTKIGTKWLSYHEALLKTESAAHLKTTSEKFSKLAERANDAEQTIEAVKFTLEFYASIGERFGERASTLAKGLAESAKGKTIRNAEQAINAFDAYKDALDKKFSAQDRQAISNALGSLDQQTMASSLSKFGKSLGFAGHMIDAVELATEATKSAESGNWAPFYIKAETLILGQAAGVILGLAFGLTMATPIGILGFGLLLAATGVLIDETLVSELNSYITDL
ncbi:MAG: colicin-like pore-forming protein [Pseudomonas sp.]|uniref:colicin-like pore-forming protein n=1 Tax=Pseudomonas sp. TaxID=306 RepID=UPI002386C2B3|nr:colicin-like pore-forming protein [Pseudomonas sp.]MDE1197433.1 colicin-like pore-forming protein [Pseudomonas sp.]